MQRVILSINPRERDNMYAPKIERYLRLQSFQPAVRTWIRFWLDGLHDGTHVHWQLSPLAVLSFGKLASLLQPLETWKSHLQAMIRMANRRRALNCYFSTMPASTNEMQWVSFFGDQERDTDQLLKQLTDWHLKWISAGDISTAF